MAPSGIILEPNEKVILATRPLFLWEPLVILDILLLILALYFTSTQPTLMVLFLALFAVLTLWLVVRWIPWSARWFVLTDRRVITKRGVLNRTQAALLLDRVVRATPLLRLRAGEVERWTSEPGIFVAVLDPDYDLRRFRIAALGTD